MSSYLENRNRSVKNFGADAVEPEPAAGLGGVPFPTDIAPEGQVPPVGAEEAPFPPVPESTMDAAADSGRPPVASGKSAEVYHCNPGFTSVEAEVAPFAKEFTPKMENPVYIGNTEMLLRYLFQEERRHHITMPIAACGIDPILFEHVERIALDDDDDQEAVYFAIFDDEQMKALQEAEDETTVEPTHLYELITVDGKKFMSCMTECLDEDFLHQVIAEATTSMLETGRYVFRMVGLRRLQCDDTSSPGRLLETLRLNTYEMSALCSYMSGFDAEPLFEIIDGHQCICFTTK